MSRRMTPQQLQQIMDQKACIMDQKAGTPQGSDTGLAWRVGRLEKENARLWEELGQLRCDLNKRRGAPKTENET